MIKRIAACLLFAAILLLLAATVLHRDRYRSMIGERPAAPAVQASPSTGPQPEAPAAERPAAEEREERPAEAAAETGEALLRADSLR